MRESELERLETGVETLLARHESTRALSDFGQYRDRPLDFMREELGFVPWGKQREMIESFMLNRQTVVRGCHGSGKDACLAALILYACYCRSMLVVAISATEDQLLSQLWKEVGERFSDRLPGELYARSLRIGGKARVLTRTSGSVSNLTGYHDKNGCFVAISEGQAEQVQDAAFDAATANAIDDLSRIVAAGNPIEAQGRFYEIHQRATWHQVRMSAFDHPNIAEQRMVIPGGPAPSMPERIAAEYGLNSPFYCARVLAEFPEEGATGSLTTRALIREAFTLHDAGDLASLHEWDRPVLGCDIAEHGGDRTVIAVARGPVISEFHAWSGLPVAPRDPPAIRVDNSADRIRAIAERLTFRMKGRPEETRPHLVVDAIGVGSGCAENLQGGRYHVTAFKASHTPPMPDKFKNMRSCAYWHTRTLLEKGKIALPRNEKLLEELAAITYQITPAGLIQLIAKDDLKKIIRRSPDHADSVIMALSESVNGIGRRAQIFRVAI